MLTHKQMLQTLPKALAQVKSGNASEKLLNEVREVIYSLYQEKEITKKVYNNIMNSKMLQNGMDTIIMYSKNNKTSALHRLLID